MSDEATLRELANHINVVLRLAAAAYDQTTLLKQAMLVLGASADMDTATRARFVSLLQDVNGAEQEAQHAIRLMLNRRQPISGP